MNNQLDQSLSSWKEQSQQDLLHELAQLKKTLESSSHRSLWSSESWSHERMNKALLYELERLQINIVSHATETKSISQLEEIKTQLWTLKQLSANKQSLVPGTPAYYEFATKLADIGRSTSNVQTEQLVEISKKTFGWIPWYRWLASKAWPVT